MKRLEIPMEEQYPLIREVIDSKGSFRLFPKGTSMLPLLRQGKDSVLLVSPDGLRARDICLYRRKNGAFVLHRLMKIEKNGTLTFLGDNQLQLERGIFPDQVIAVVSHVFRGEKKISVKKCSYRCYVWLHCIYPLRWICFLPRRILGKIRRIFKKKL